MIILEIFYMNKAPSVVFGCNCTNYVGYRKYGNCEKKSWTKLVYPFPEKFSCYVHLPSSCPDLVSSMVNSKEYPDKKISAEACQDNPNIAGKTTSIKFVL